MTLLCWWLFLCICIKLVTNILYRSPSPQTCHQHNSSPTSGTNIDIIYPLTKVEQTQTDRRRYDRQRRTISLNDEYIELLGQKLAWKYLAKPFYHTENIMIFKYSIKWVTETTYSNSKSQKYSNPLSLSHFQFTMREMIALFLLIFTYQNAQATEEVNLRQLVNSLQMNMNAMSSKMTTFDNKIQSLESEIKVGAELKNFESWTKNNFLKLWINLSSIWKVKMKTWNQLSKWRRLRNRF